MVVININKSWGGRKGRMLLSIDTRKALLARIVWSFATFNEDCEFFSVFSYGYFMRNCLCIFEDLWSWLHCILKSNVSNSWDEYCSSCEQDLPSISNLLLIVTDISSLMSCETSLAESLCCHCFHPPWGVCYSME